MSARILVTASNELVMRKLFKKPGSEHEQSLLEKFSFFKTKTHC